MVFHRSDVEEIKAFLARQVDRARLAWGRLPTDQPRQCVFFGTTNSDSFLRDQQNRRFWPVAVKRFDLAALARDVDQIWAEASAAEAAGESIRLHPRLYGAAAQVQNEYRQPDPWAEAIHVVLRDLTGKVSVEDIWKILGKPVGQRLQQDNRHIGEAMRKLGFERKHTYLYGRMQWCYVRHMPDTTREQVINVFYDPVTRECSAGYAPENIIQSSGTNFSGFRTDDPPF